MFHGYVKSPEGFENQMAMNDVPADWWVAKYRF
jgi:hypothetical protein